jgi:hypothetical protein
VARSSAVIEEIDILWMTAGLSCDGDTIAMTGATQPSIEDIVTGSALDSESQVPQPFSSLRKWK